MLELLKKRGKETYIIRIALFSTPILSVFMGSCDFDRSFFIQLRYFRIRNDVLVISEFLVLYF